MTPEINLEFTNKCNMCKLHNSKTAENICKSCKSQINREVVIVNFLALL